MNIQETDQIAQKITDITGAHAPFTMSGMDSLLQKLQGQRIDADNRMKTNARTIVHEKNTNTENILFTILHKAMPEERTLFTVMEQLSLILLNLEPDGAISHSIQHMEPDFDAANLAAALLMPKTEFLTECAKNQNPDTGTVNVTKLAGYFNVTVQAALVRGMVLGLWH